MDHTTNLWDTASILESNIVGDGQTNNYGNRMFDWMDTSFFILFQISKGFFFKVHCNWPRSNFNFSVLFNNIDKWLNITSFFMAHRQENNLASVMLRDIVFSTSLMSRWSRLPPFTRTKVKEKLHGWNHPGHGQEQSIIDRLLLSPKVTREKCCFYKASVTRVAFDETGPTTCSSETVRGRYLLPWSKCDQTLLPSNIAFNSQGKHPETRKLQDKVFFPNTEFSLFWVSLQSELGYLQLQQR